MAKGGSQPTTSNAINISFCSDAYNVVSGWMNKDSDDSFRRNEKEINENVTRHHGRAGVGCIPTKVNKEKNKDETCFLGKMKNRKRNYEETDPTGNISESESDDCSRTNAIQRGQKPTPSLFQQDFSLQRNSLIMSKKKKTKKKKKGTKKSGTSNS